MGMRLARGPATADIMAAVAAAVVVLVITRLVSPLQHPVRPLDPAGIGLITSACLALAWRRVAPVATLVVVVLAVASYLLADYPYGPIQLCMVVAMFEVARLRPFRVGILACVAAVVVIAGAMLSRALLSADTPALLFAIWASWLVVPWSVGALVQVRSAAVQRARQELAARAALEERMRVAREVHDVAGHGFSAVAMQAGVALLVFDEQPEQARRSLEAIRETSTSALADLRATVDVLSAAGLPALGSLIESVRAAGLTVELCAVTDGVPDDVGRIAYRVVQEALTNVLRHAGPTSAEVHVRREQAALTVEVLDRGRGAVQVDPGRGIDGMRDRVRAIGGELDAGPRSGGGFRVAARLPLPGVAR